MHELLPDHQEMAGYATVIHTLYNTHIYSTHTHYTTIQYTHYIIHTLYST